MLLRTDDDIYVVDQRWLGPPGRELPVHPRYAAVGWGAALYVLVMLIERAVLHLPLGFWSIAYTTLGVVALIKQLMKHVNPDRPVLAVVRGWGQELTSPRPPRARRRDTPTRARLRLLHARAAPPV